VTLTPTAFAMARATAVPTPAGTLWAAQSN
jgi:hypothetical protein